MQTSIGDGVALKRPLPSSSVLPRSWLIGIVVCSLLLSVSVSAFAACPPGFSCSAAEIGWGDLFLDVISEPTPEAGCRAALKSEDEFVFYKGDIGSWQIECHGFRSFWYAWKLARCPVDPRDIDGRGIIGNPFWLRMFPRYSYQWPLPPSRPSFLVSIHEQPEYTCWARDGAIYPPKNVGLQQCSVVGGNPIHLGLGIKLQVEHDYRASASTLMFERVYTGDASIGHGIALGTGWVHTYQRRLELATGSTGGTVHAYREDGRVLQFDYAPSGIVPDPDISDRLTELKDAGGTRTGWRYRWQRRKTRKPMMPQVS